MQHDDLISASPQVYLVLGRSKEGLGFLKDPSRVNVAISRAKQGLTIIGEKETMKKHSKWKKIVEVCAAEEANGAELADGFGRTPKKIASTASSTLWEAKEKAKEVVTRQQEANKKREMYRKVREQVAAESKNLFGDGKWLEKEKRSRELRENLVGCY